MGMPSRAHIPAVREWDSKARIQIGAVGICTREYQVNSHKVYTLLILLKKEIYKALISFVLCVSLASLSEN